MPLTMKHLRQPQKKSSVLGISVTGFFGAHVFLDFKVQKNSCPSISKVFILHTNSFWLPYDLCKLGQVYFQRTESVSHAFINNIFSSRNKICCSALIECINKRHSQYTIGSLSFGQNLQALLRSSLCHRCPQSSSAIWPSISLITRFRVN